MKRSSAAESSLLEAWYARGRAAYPELDLDRTAFAAQLSRSEPAPDASADVDTSIEDIYLVAACVARIDRAARIFRDRFGPKIRRALERLSLSAAAREDLEQHLYERLLVGTATAEPQIKTFAGRAPLAAWLVVVAQRAGLASLRAERAHARARDGAASQRMAQSIFGPAAEYAEGGVIKEQVRPLVKQALARALAELPARQRTVLHLQVVGGAGVERLARMYGVSPSTISRWVARARAAILQRTRDLLSTELRLTPAETDSLMTLVASQLEVSVADLEVPGA